MTALAKTMLMSCLVAVLACPACPACTATTIRADCSLPEAIQKALDSRYSGWNVVSLDDLDAEDKRLWIERYSTRCPGVATGEFTGNQKGIAVELLKHKGDTSFEMLIVWPDVRDGSISHVLDKPSEVARPSVIRTLPPGRYSGAENSKAILAPFDAITEEAIEAGIVLFYWNGRRFRSIIISE